MHVGLCYSGGKDSTLAALLLDSFYDVTLVAATFGVTDAAAHARDAAAAVGFPLITVELDESVARDAVDRMVEDGYPRTGIQRVHDHALETVAAGEFRIDAADELRSFDAIADGTRRDDRVPTVSRAQAQSIEDRHDVDYLAPLSGFGRSAVDDLVDATLEVETGPSEEIAKGDYEAELRALMAEEYGDDAVTEVFPAHDQTRVVGLREH
ncbi:alpha hydrolase [Halorientalis brevis]|uniref:Alpha hydrolase n=1 Tax=Halorientalis brevis TaxID=1126241 RepID=A0ABD6C993_9EURY|nr:alpha hydrolase [Halorientalis brevis]